MTGANRRSWLPLLLLGLPGLLVTMDLTVLFLAIPQVTAELRPSSTELLWISDIYGFFIAGALLVSGALGDRFGRRRVLLLGALAFAAASVLASVASSPETLILARGLQGMAGAALLPSMMALVFTLYPDEQQRTAALGVLMSTFALGAALGPLLGGGLLAMFDWRAVFVPNVAIMLGLLVLGPRHLPEAKTGTGRVDLASAALSVTCILTVVYGLTSGARDGFGAAEVAGLAAGSVALGGFVARQRRLTQPLVDLRLFRDRAFSGALLATTIAMFVTYGTFFFTSQYLQLVAGLTPIEAGLWGLPPVAAMMVVSGAVLPKLARKVKPAALIATGMLVACAGLLLLTGLHADSSVLQLVVAVTVLMLGLAPTTTMGINLIVGAAPPEQAGTVSGLGQAGNELGGALGIALLGSLGGAIYRADVRGAVPDTLGGAAAVGGRTLDVAAHAFTHGLHVVAAVAVGLLVVTSALVAVALRAPRTTAPTTTATTPAGAASSTSAA